MKRQAEAGPADRRPERRASTLLAGVVVTLDGSAEHDCTLRDLSEHGARLALPKTVPLPEEFYLMHVRERTAYQVKVVWRIESSIGVQFVSALPLGGKTPLFLRKAWLRRAVG